MTQDRFGHRVPTMEEMHGDQSPERDPIDVEMDARLMRYHNQR